jgi:hypothetical protein
MSCVQLLAAKKQEILKRWFQVTVDSYPADTARFIKNQKDPFANPVGQSTYQSLDALVDALISGAERDTMTLALDPIIRIRAVQSFTPSQATSLCLFPEADSSAASAGRWPSGGCGYE